MGLILPKHLKKLEGSVFINDLEEVTVCTLIICR